MRRYLGVFCKRMLLIWAVWSSLLTSYEWVRLQIPMTLYLYEEEAEEVLSNSQEKLSAETLYLDFTGDVKLQENSIKKWTN